MMEKMRTKEEILNDMRTASVGERGIAELLADSRDLLDEIRRKVEEANRLTRLR